MRRYVFKVAIVAAFAAVMWPAARAANAQCTNLADKGDAVCKADVKCQDAIIKASLGYTTAVQKAALKMIDTSFKSTLGALPAQWCVGGVNNGKSCLGNNGVCKKGAKGKLCTVDGDCGAGGQCDGKKGCNLCDTSTSKCGDGSACTSNADCTPDVYECVPNPGKNLGSADVGKAQAKLSASITKACSDAGVDAADLGIANIPGCSADIDGGSTSPEQFDGLVTCIEKSLVGDFSTGQVKDGILQQISRAAGTGGLSTTPQGKPGLADESPRLVAQLQGPSVLQIGNGASTTDDTITTGGTVTYMNFAHCVGGNGNAACMRDKDCGTDDTGNAGVCTSDCSGNTCIGHSTSPAGTTLSITPTCSTGLATCLHTKTVQIAGLNGSGLIATVDLGTGSFQSTAPISTDVFISNLGNGAIVCSTFHTCPVCESGACTGECMDSGTLAATGTSCTSDSDCGGGANVCTITAAKGCSAADGATTTECLPDFGGAGTIPNPYNLSTDDTALFPAILVNGSAPPDNTFCGNCSTTTSIGCQQDSECPASETCDFGAVTEATGFNGDTGATSVASPGVKAQYAPTISGVFCTGKTGNTGVDGPAGLPGPVRFIAQAVNAFGYTKDH